MGGCVGERGGEEELDEWIQVFSFLGMSETGGERRVVVEFDVVWCFE